LTKNYTGAEIESLVKSAVSFAIARSTNVMDFSAKLKIDESKLKVEKNDFIRAMEEVKPQFGIDEDKFNLYF
jgi:vesicle-fusing ATPase